MSFKWSPFNKGFKLLHLPTQSVAGVSEVEKSFSSEELKILSSNFKGIDSSGQKKIGKQEFQKCLGFLGIENLSDFLFNAFDKNKDGQINYVEFLAHLSILLKGSPNEKLEFAFSMLDLDGDGQITKTEFLTVVKAMVGVIESMNLKAPYDPEEFVNEAFKSLDKNSDGFITLEEYKKGATENPFLFKGLGIIASTSIDSTGQEDKDHDKEDQKSTTKESETSHGKEKSEIKRKNSKIETEQNDVVTFGSEMWDKVLDMMIGMRLASDYSAILSREIKSQDFTVKLSFDIPHMNEKDTAKTFFDYAPNVFKQIRNMSGITESSYSLSIGPEQIVGSLLLGTLASLSGKMSSGKSGSFFFTTHDGNYLLKTISIDESFVFRSFLSLYYDFLLQNPDSLLSRVFALHRIGDTHFIVQSNIFNSAQGGSGSDLFGTARRLPVDEIYDLKGSTVGRSNPNGKVKKDKDLQRKIMIGKKEKDRLMKIIQKDVDFLMKQNIIDYSLVIGIHKRNSQTSPDICIPKDDVTTRNFPSNFVFYSEDASEIYLIGVIDIFTEFNLKKKSELALKKITNITEQSGISCQPPTKYGPRFLKFIDSKIQ